MTSLRTGYIYHELFGWHDTGTNTGFFPSDPARGLQPFVNYENAETKRRIHELIVVSGLIDHLDRRTARHATTEELLLVHPQEYLDRLKKTSEQRLGGDAGDGETPLAKGGYEIGTLGVGSVTQLMQDAIAGHIDNGYALVRPPGHHANAVRGMGFCILNNVALAARFAREHLGVRRVLIVDWDVHHGNGTQDIFYELIIKNLISKIKYMDAENSRKYITEYSKTEMLSLKYIVIAKIFFSKLNIRYSHKAIKDFCEYIGTFDTLSKTQQGRKFILSKSCIIDIKINSKNNYNIIIT